MADAKKQPNVVIIYADDLGFGDVSCYGATDISTPNVDALADNGVKFTDGYSTASTCTPARYSLLTGIYPWRNPRAHILPGDAPSIISDDTPSMPKMFSKAGYKTAIVGKWHLGMGDGNLDWNESLPGTPNDVGFEYSYIMAATNDRVPCVYVENRNVDGLDPEDPIEVTYDWDKAFPGQPTGRHNPELLKMMYSHGHDATIVNGVSRIGHMRGGKAALWDDETMAETFLGKAQEFIKENKDEPFFLYYALHQPHVPRIPSPKFVGATGLGPRGDVIAEMDWCVGELIKTLEEQGLKDDTIVIFSSDNGPVLDDGYVDRAPELTGDHRPAGPLRGGKYSMYEGGTRVPFILSWPAEVAPQESQAVVCHVDFYASFAAMVEQPLAGGDAIDSENVLDALLGKSGEGRSELVTEGIGAKTIIRQDNWLFIPPHDGPAVFSNTNIESGNSPDPQLFDLDDDVGQVVNLADQQPERAQRMNRRLDEILASSASANR